MKFGENLQYYATAEWRDKYIDYEKLKTLLEDAQTSHTDTYTGDDEKEKPKQLENFRFSTSIFLVQSRKLLGTKFSSGRSLNN